jgi:hypothetical protein
MSNPTFSEWVSNEVTKKILSSIRLLAFEEEGYHDRPDYFGCAFSWMILTMGLTLSGVFLLPTPFWRMLWLKIFMPFCLISPTILYLRAKYRYEVGDEE